MKKESIGTVPIDSRDWIVMLLVLYHRYISALNYTEILCCLILLYSILRRIVGIKVCLI